MKLNELLKMINADTNIRVTLDGDYVVRHCYDPNSLDDEYMDCKVNSMFATTVIDYNSQTAVPVISIDVASPIWVEVWHTEDFDDFAKVTCDRATHKVVDIQASGWDWSGKMTRKEAVKILERYGYTEYDPQADFYDSYEAWDDDVSCGGAYEYV